MTRGHNTKGKTMNAIKTHMTITRTGTEETITLRRDVSAQHPAWVHGQMGTTSEVELQAALDNYGPECIGMGPDVCGIEVVS